MQLSLIFVATEGRRIKRKIERFLFVFLVSEESEKFAITDRRKEV